MRFAWGRGPICGLSTGTKGRDTYAFSFAWRAWRVCGICGASRRLGVRPCRRSVGQGSDNDTEVARLRRELHRPAFGRPARLRGRGRRLRGNRAPRRARSSTRRPMRQAVRRVPERQACRCGSPRSGRRQVYDYDFSFNGFAADERAQAAKLATVAGVASVTKDVLQQPTPRRRRHFLGLDRPVTGLWAKLGGPSKAGEDVIIGVVDTGIWPEHPSFSDRRTTSSGRARAASVRCLRPAAGAGTARASPVSSSRWTCAPTS